MRQQYKVTRFTSDGRMEKKINDQLTKVQKDINDQLTKVQKDINGPVLATQLEPNILPLTVYNLIVTSATAGWTPVRCIGYVYKDLNGNYRIKLNINGTVTTGYRTSHTMTIAGLTFKTAGGYQALSVYAAVGNFACTIPTSGDIKVDHASANTSSYNVSGDVELESKPTWLV